MAFTVTSLVSGEFHAEYCRDCAYALNTLPVLRAKKKKNPETEPVHQSPFLEVNN
jgi:hypothetical protein